MNLCLSCLNTGQYGVSDGRRKRADKVPDGPKWLRFCVCKKGRRMKKRALGKQRAV